jgi:hypothetical protein
MTAASRQKKINESDDDDDLDAAALSDDKDVAPRYVVTQFISCTINMIGGIADKEVVGSIQTMDFATWGIPTILLKMPIIEWQSSRPCWPRYNGMHL